ncbi:hypothetical protein PFISCL1PPCAC_6020, partial [Pristionchus fissidentatus]
FRMKSIGTLLLLVASTFAYDAVIFSSTTKITKDSPSLESLISSASAESPLIFFTNPDFVLGQFSKAAAAYSTKKSDSSIVNSAKAAKYAESRFVPSAVHVPTASIVSESTPLKTGQSVYVVSSDNWSSLDKLASEILAVVGEKATVVITNSDVVSTNPVRVKRVAGVDDAINSFPLVIPDVTKEAERKTCLFYLEGLNFYTKSADGKYLSARLRDDGTGNTKYSYEAPQCEDIPATAKNGPQTVVFSFKVVPATTPNADSDKGWTSLSAVALKLTLTVAIDGYWSLTKAELTEPLSIKYDGGTETKVEAGEAQKKSLDYLDLTSVFGYSWNCWDSQAIFFGDKAKPSEQIGISFHGIQIAVYGKDYGKSGTPEPNMSYFGSKVDSCTGTFSVASWMGIITSLVLIAVFIFGFLMLNSVQTGDRYDDPKQKQILINVRE